MAEKIKCPNCGSDDVEGIPQDCDTGFCSTGGGIDFRCNKCKYWFSG